MIDTTIMQDASEVVHYNNPDFPLYINRALLSEYPGMRALCHWHEDIELIYIIRGEMNYEINGKRFLLQEKDSLIVNSRQMHYGFSHLSRECEFICILFHPSLLAADSYLYEKYVLPITQPSGLEYLHCPASDPFGVKAGQTAVQICALAERSGCSARDMDSDYSKNPAAFEMEAVGYLNLLWSALFCHLAPLLQNPAAPPSSDLDLQRKMVSYIYQHYNDTVCLDDIAAAGNMSRSKCCILFKRYLHQSPIDFLNAYRLEVCCHMLTHTDSGITRIATACGFSHLSYFSRLFRRRYGCTPSDYRRNRRN